MTDDAELDAPERFAQGDELLLGEVQCHPGNSVPQRDRVEPYLAALLQTEHLNLLIGSGLPASLCGGPIPSVGAPQTGRWHLHFIPTSSSWLNLVERWFKELTDRRLRRGVFTSVDDLINAIEMWTEHWNDDPQPFIWHKTAEDIIEKVRRGRTTLHQIKTATDH